MSNSDSELVLLLGIKGAGKKTIRERLQRLYPQRFPQKVANIQCLNLANWLDDPFFDIILGDSFGRVIIPVYVINYDRKKAHLRIQTYYFKKLDFLLAKHASDATLLILIHKKDLFIDPVQKRSVREACSKLFKRQYGNALMVFTSVKDYALKRTFNKILKLRKIRPPAVAEPRMVLPPPIRLSLNLERHDFKSS